MTEAERVEQIYHNSSPDMLTPEGWQFLIKMARIGASVMPRPIEEAPCETMTHTDPIRALVDLKALAEAATPGPWAYEAHGDTMTYGVGVLIDPCGDDDDQCAGEQITGVMIVSEAVAVEVQGQANAAFIAAANPKTILAAIEALTPIAARIEALEEALKEVTECFSEDYSIAHPRSQAALKLASKMTKPRI